METKYPILTSYRLPQHHNFLHEDYRLPSWVSADDTEQDSEPGGGGGGGSSDIITPQMIYEQRNILMKRQGLIATSTSTISSAGSTSSSNVTPNLPVSTNDIAETATILTSKDGDELTRRTEVWNGSMQCRTLQETKAPPPETEAVAVASKDSDQTTTEVWNGLMYCCTPQEVKRPPDTEAVTSSSAAAVAAASKDGDDEATMTEVSSGWMQGRIPPQDDDYRVFENTKPRRKRPYLAISLVVFAFFATTLGIVWWLLGDDILLKISNPAPSARTNKNTTVSNNNRSRCQAIVNGRNVTGQESMEHQLFDMYMDVRMDLDSFSFRKDRTQVAALFLEELKDKAQGIWMPILAGCKAEDVQSAEKKMKQPAPRQNWNYTVGNAHVANVIILQQNPSISSTSNCSNTNDDDDDDVCFPVLMKLHLYLLKKDNIIATSDTAIVELGNQIMELFRAGNNIEPMVTKLGLLSPVTSINVTDLIVVQSAAAGP
eukprot:scaffold8800_cov107-Cylindrotheca_fusiformis.AAC.1